MEGSRVSEARPTTSFVTAEPSLDEQRPRTRAAPRLEDAPGFHLGYQPGLDGIRGIAVVLIILFHSFIMWPGSYGHLVPGAYITVNMFFVLSGFLITSLLLEEHHRHGRISFSGFYERRALRLLPALGFVLIVHLIYTAVTGAPLGPEFSAIGWIASYGANWAQWAGHMGPMTTALAWGHTWTLSVEEQFYLVWPALLTLAFFFRPKIRTVVLVLVGLVGAVTIARAAVTAGVHVPPGPNAHGLLAARLESVVGFRTDLRADTVLLGALAALLLHAGWQPGRWFRPFATLVLAGLLWVSFFVQPGSRWMYLWGFTLVDAGGAVLCIAVLDRRWRASTILWQKPCAWLGRLSYALYLWHPVVFVAVITQAPKSWPIASRLAIGWSTTLVCACISYYCVERPFLKLKGRLSRRAHGTTRGTGSTAPAVAR